MTSTAHVLTGKEKVGRGLDALAVGLRPFVDERVGGAGASGQDWVELLEARDELRDGRARQYSANDPLFLLRVVVDERQVFGDVLSPSDLELA